MITDTLKFAKGMYMYFFDHSDTPSVQENFNLITLEQCLEVTDFKKFDTVNALPKSMANLLHFVLNDEVRHFF